MVSPKLSEWCLSCHRWGSISFYQKLTGSFYQKLTGLYDHLKVTSTRILAEGTSGEGSQEQHLTDPPCSRSKYWKWLSSGHPVESVPHGTKLEEQCTGYGSKSKPEPDLVQMWSRRIRCDPSSLSLLTVHPWVSYLISLSFSVLILAWDLPCKMLCWLNGPMCVKHSCAWNIARSQ